MTRVEKVTISVPAELMAHVERRRQEIGANRSAAVTDLLWRGWRQLEDERREERYRAAYQAQPETVGELEWADLAAAELFKENKTDKGDQTGPDSASKPKRRAAG